MAGKGSTTGSGFHVACRDTGRCTHKKHGFTRKDRPAPGFRVKAQPKSDAQIKEMAAQQISRMFGRVQSEEA